MTEELRSEVPEFQAEDYAELGRHMLDFVREGGDYRDSPAFAAYMDDDVDRRGSRVYDLHLWSEIAAKGRAVSVTGYVDMAAEFLGDIPDLLAVVDPAAAKRRDRCRVLVEDAIGRAGDPEYLASRDEQRWMQEETERTHAQSRTFARAFTNAAGRSRER